MSIIASAVGTIFALLFVGLIIGIVSWFQNMNSRLNRLADKVDNTDSAMKNMVATIATILTTPKSDEKTKKADTTVKSDEYFG